MAQAFFAAIKNGKPDEVRALLAQDPGLLHEYDKDLFQATPLNAAVEQGDRAMVDVLLDAGADIDEKSDWWAGGFAPLHVTLWKDDTGMAEHLIARGATVDVHAAAGLGRTERVEELLDADPDLVHARGGDGQFPLHFAKTVEIAGLLLDRGALVDARDLDHEATAAHWAAAPRPDVCRFLLDHGAECDVFMLCALGDVERLRVELADDPGLVHARITRARFPCHGGKAAGHIYLFNFGENTTPLHVAARCGQAEVARQLLAAGADPDARGGYDDAVPLHVAAWHDEPGVVRALVAGGATIDLESGKIHGNPPVGWGVVSGARDAVEALLESGASMRDHYLADALAGKRGEFRAWSRAPQEHYTAIARMLEARA